MKKILIFGATGHMGAYTVDYLRENIDQSAYEIVTIGRKETLFYANQDIPYYRVDVTKKEDFEKLPQQDIHAIICYVGLMPAATEGIDPRKYVDVNVTGILNILEYARNVQADRFIFTQTEADLSGHWKENVLIKPDMPRKYPLNSNYSMYVITKCAAVDMIESYHQKYGMKRFIFRLPTVYHFRQDPYYYKDGKKVKLGYRRIIEQALKGEKIEVWGNPDLKKEIVYVKDFTQMVFKAIISEHQGGIYNVGNGVPVSLLDQIKGIIKVFSPNSNPSEIELRPDKPDSRSFSMDITNAIEELNYKPSYSYLDYLKDFKNEMEINRYKDLWEE